MTEPFDFVFVLTDSKTNKNVDQDREYILN